MKRHPLEILSLLSGLTFLTFAIIYLVTGNAAGTPMFSIMIPLLLVGLGGAGIAAMVAAQRNQNETGAAAVATTSPGSEMGPESGHQGN